MWRAGSGILGLWSAVVSLFLISAAAHATGRDSAVLRLRANIPSVCAFQASGGTFDVGDVSRAWTLRIDMEVACNGPWVYTLRPEYGALENRDRPASASAPYHLGTSVSGHGGGLSLTPATLAACVGSGCAETVPQATFGALRLNLSGVGGTPGLLSGDYVETIRVEVVPLY